MKKLNEMIEEAEALDDNFKISKDILLIRLKDCKEELKKQLTLTDVVVPKGTLCDDCKELKTDTITLCKECYLND